MQYIIFILGFAFFVELFVLFLLARDDYIFLRKNISLEQLFNIAFLTFFVSVLASRIVYVMLHPAWGYLNPLVFLIFPYFPGLTLSGGMVGGVGFIFWICRKKTMPTLRMLDVFALASLPSYGIGLVLYDILLLVLKEPVEVFLFIQALFFLLFSWVFISKFFKNTWKDGNATLFVLLTFCFFSLLLDIAVMLQKKIVLISPEDIMFLFIFLITFTFIFRKDNIFSKRSGGSVK